VLHAARWKSRIQKIAKNSPSGHHRTTLLGYVLQLRHISTIGKKLLNSDVSPTCPHNMMNFGPLAAEICWRVWGTPANFNRFRVLAFVTARHSSSGRQPKFAALNRGCHLHSAGRPSRWALAHILVSSFFLSSSQGSQIGCLPYFHI